MKEKSLFSEICVAQFLVLALFFVILRFLMRNPLFNIGERFFISN